jgi:hypothetical protein
LEINLELAPLHEPAIRPNCCGAAGQNVAAPGIRSMAAETNDREEKEVFPAIGQT